jgi:D-aspartate ligase
MRDTGLPSVLLTESSYLSTLAAVRSFGRAGIPCVVACDSRLGAASWSRFARRRVRCPSYTDSGELLEWLLAFGAKHPGHVLYATSDDMAWLYALHHAELSRHFRMYQPPVETVYGLLNKQRLMELAHASGIEFPRMWFPRSEDDLQRIAESARFPVLFKPVTQVFHGNHGKGVIVDRPQELAGWYAALRHQPYAQDLLAFDPDVRHPLIQEFQTEALGGIYSISGFIDEAGELLGARAALKILQRPRRIGVGVCFEHAELKPELVTAVIGMCRRAGFFGAFEVEFIQSEDRYLMIDFNPRFYGQMAFDVARGLQIPLMAYYSALGDRQKVLELSAAAQRTAHSSGVDVHCNRLEFEIMVWAQRAARGLSSKEVAAWRTWYGRHRLRMVDPVLDSDDRRPFLAELTRQVLNMMLHPRSFLRSTMMSLAACGLNTLPIGLI